MKTFQNVQNQSEEQQLGQVKGEVKWNHFGFLF